MSQPLSDASASKWRRWTKLEHWLDHAGNCLCVCAMTSVERQHMPASIISNQHLFNARSTVRLAIRFRPNMPPGHNAKGPSRGCVDPMVSWSCPLSKQDGARDDVISVSIPYRMLRPWVGNCAVKKVEASLERDIPSFLERLTAAELEPQNK